uniref:Uncharacterized protein n=1 Tax=Setaria italica TaxID=4555 RepID=K3YNS0_SETIT
MIKITPGIAMSSAFNYVHLAAGDKFLEVVYGTCQRGPPYHKSTISESSSHNYICVPLANL